MTSSSDSIYDTLIIGARSAGLYAAGDITNSLHQICIAQAHGVVAAAAIHQALI